MQSKLAPEIDARRSPRARRGSFLVMVVGVLVLMAVIAVVYVAISRSDRQGGAAFVNAGRADRVPHEMAQYIAGVIADDLFDTVNSSHALGLLPGQDPSPMREAWDYPSTAQFEQSFGSTAPIVSRPAGAELRFTPTGNGSGADPWLASTTPTWIPVTSATGQITDARASMLKHLRQTDWGNATNIAPDGRFVNLYNLRPQAAGGAVGGGFAADAIQMSQSLSVFDDRGQVVPLTTAEANTPALLSANQRNAFLRPADINPAGPLGPRSPFWPGYQWVDTDGDGFDDARVFEMLDATAPTSANWVRLIANDPNTRYFFAARIVDLSAAINVNTAFEFSTPPDPTGLPGTTPADVDLRRLLTMEDLALDYPPPSGSSALYGMLHQPTPNEIRASPTLLEPQDYTPYDEAIAPLVAGEAYLTLRQARRDGLVPARGEALAPAPPSPRERSSFFESIAGRPDGVAMLRGATGGADSYRLGGVAGLGDLLELLTFRGVNNPAVTSRLESAMAVRSTPPVLGLATTRARLNPLRDARSLWYERDVTPDNPGLLPLIREQMLARSALDLRQHLTPLSGARPLRPAMKHEARTPDELNAFTSSIGGFEQKVDALDLLARRDSQALFRAWADVLLPFADWPNAWPGAAIDEGVATLFYGHRGPELPLMLAAHLTANTLDAFDADHAPTAQTLLVDEAFLAALARDAAQGIASRTYPWSAMRPRAGVLAVKPSGGGGWRNSPVPVYDGLLDLNVWYERVPEADQGPVQAYWRVDEAQRDPTSAGMPNRLAKVQAGAAGAVRNRAVTVFGAEAQPFITEAATFFVYANKRSSQVGFTPNTSHATIRDGLLGPNGIFATGAAPGSNELASRDLLFQCFAVQLTNPFPFELNLTDLGYYLEFAGQHYRMHRYSIQAPTGSEPPSSGPFPLVLRPYESTVVFALNDQVADVVRVLDKTDDDNANNSITAAGLVSWLSMQCRVRDYFYRTLSGTQVIAQQGPDPELTLVPFYDPVTDVPRAAGQLPINPLSDLGTISVVAPMDDPLRRARNGEVRLWRRVVNTDAGETPQTNTLANDQLMDRLVDPRWFDAVRSGGANASSLYTNPTLDRHLRLPGDRVGDTEPDPDEVLGIVTAASIRRPNWPTGGGPGGQRFRTPVGAVPAYAVESKAANLAFARSYNRGDKSAAGTAPGPVRSLDRQFFERGDPEAATGFRTMWIRQLTEQVTNRVHLGDRAEEKTGNDIPLNLSSVSFRDLNAEIWLDNQRFMRQIPGGSAEARGIVRVGDLLLPLAIGPMFDPELPDYPSREPHNPAFRGSWTTLGEALANALDYDFSTQPGDVLHRLGNTQGPDIRSHGPLTKGRLHLDRYSCFYDADADLLFTPPQQAGSGQERPMGTVAPMAWRVFDVFAPMYRVENAGRPVAKSEDFGSRTRATPGMINLGTAPLTVLRSLPLVSPPTNSIPGTDPWWWTGSGAHDGRSDIAATITAFRDKQPVEPRGMPGTYLWFRDNITGQAPPNGRQLNAAQATDPLGAQAFNEFPGLRTLGEVFAARAPFVTGAYSDAFSIDRIGKDALATGYPAANPAIAVDTPITLINGNTATGSGTPNVVVHDIPRQVADSYAEQLSVMNAISHAASVRSDLYAAWFVVMGFKRGDVEGLSSQDDALVPSVRRRFLMVVDRSNVLKKGDSPRVLMLKELPN